MVDCPEIILFDQNELYLTVIRLWKTFLWLCCIVGSVGFLFFLFFFFDCAVYFQGMKGKIDEYSDSDDDQHDAYLERMKAEGKIREEGNDSDESDGESGE